MRRITFYTRDDCHLCDSARFVLDRVRRDIPFELEVIDVDSTGREAEREKYTHHVPVIHLDGVEISRHRLAERCLREWLRK